MNGNGIVDIPSSLSVDDTMDRLESLLGAKGIKVFARFDQAAEARSVGLSMPDTQLLIFGDPRVGTPMMVKYPSIALDLPLKALVYAFADGTVRLSYNSPAYLMERHGLDEPPFRALEAVMRSATQRP